MIIATTDNPNAGLVAYPCTLLFTTSNWNLTQNIVVRGIKDTNALTDVTYNIVLWVVKEMSKDPWYIYNSNATFAVVNHASESASARMADQTLPDTPRALSSRVCPFPFRDCTQLPSPVSGWASSPRHAT